MQREGLRRDYCHSRSYVSTHGDAGPIVAHGE